MTRIITIALACLTCLQVAAVFPSVAFASKLAPACQIAFADSEPGTPETAIVDEVLVRVPEEQRARLQSAKSDVAELAREVRKSLAESGEESASDSGLNKEQLALMTANSAGLFSVSQLATLPEVKGGYSLGLTKVGDRSPYKNFVDALKLRHWQDAYAEFEMNPRVPNQSHHFMRKLTAKQESIVFFVPKDILTHERARVTKAELTWLFEHPEQMKHVHFVFGAYDLMTPKIEEIEAKIGIPGLADLVFEIAARK